jgi:hypothetical protein
MAPWWTTFTKSNDASALAALIKMEFAKMSAKIDELRTIVQEARTVQASAVLLIQGLKTKLDEAVAAGDLEQVASIAADLHTSTAELANAVSANTAAEQEPAPAPTEPPPAPEAPAAEAPVEAPVDPALAPEEPTT